MPRFLRLFSCLLLAAACGTASPAVAGTVKTKIDVFDLIRDGRTEIHLGPAKDLNDPPSEIFRMRDGALHISGRGYGYLATKQSFGDYHLVVEFKWGPNTWGKRKTRARDNGILYHITGPHGALGKTWPACFEANIIQGGMGDLLVLNAKTEDGANLTHRADCEFELDRDGEKRWKKGTPRQAVTKGRINWEKRDEDWKDSLTFAGKHDLDAPVGGWNRLEVIARGDTVTHIFNGKLVNEAFAMSPHAGKVGIQTEGAETIVRRFELWPLDTFEEKWPPAP
ncbi:hypothetical protein M2447_000484 [Ereboglobus sp. PH5-10]|nr:hypothetical protein [Ereboglobus sp. PH5-10]